MALVSSAYSVYFFGHIDIQSLASPPYVQVLPYAQYFLRKHFNILSLYQI